jgi:solute carrier family 35 protein
MKHSHHNNHHQEASSTKDEDDSKLIVPSKREKIFAAAFYATISMLVIFTNKWVMSGYKFPHSNFLAMVQFIVTSLVLAVLSFLKKVDIPPISFSIIREILPLSLMFLGNVTTGLGGTYALNLPMFTALRRFSIFMTMIGELLVLGTKPSSPIILSVSMMVGGAFFAALYDFTFDFNGYKLLFLNNLFTAMNGIWLKKASQSGICSKMGVLYYNSFFSATIMLTYYLFDYWIHQLAHNESTSNTLGATQELSHWFTVAGADLIKQNIVSNDSSYLEKIISFEGWNDSTFCFLFVCASFMGTVLNYSIFLCTTTNSALTTAVIGCLKNVLVAYVGMIFFHDYMFNWMNFVGLNISIIGSFHYTYITLVKGIKGYGGA